MIEDLRQSLRALARSRGLAAAVVAMLALGIGSSTAIFSVVDGVLLRPLGYPNPERIVQVWQLGRTGNRNRTSETTFQEWRDQGRSFSALAMYTAFQVPVTGGGEPVSGRVAHVSREFFQALGVAPALGRSFLSEEHRAGARPVVLVSHSFWRTHFGGAPDFSRRTLTFSNRSHQVVGVMPSGFGFPPGTELLAPSELLPPRPSRTAHNWLVVGRLRPEISLDAARAEMTAIGRRQKAQYGEGIWLTGVEVVPLHEQVVGASRRPLLLLFGAVGCLLLIACANVVNLLLARAASRRRELAVRIALGASSWRLLRQHLAESLVLAAAGGVLGVAVAHASLRALVALAPATIPRLGEVGVDGRVVLFAVALSVSVAAALAVLLGMRARHENPDEALHGGRGEVGGISRARGAIVALQVGLTAVLLVGAGLLARSFVELMRVEPGFRTQGVVAMDLSLRPAASRAEVPRFFQLFRQTREELSALPGVVGVGSSNALPLSGGGSNGQFLIENDPDDKGYAEYRLASPGYFETMAIPLVRGRLFQETDGPDTPHVAVCSESAARQLFGARDPIGLRIQWGNMDGDERLITIVGVVGDVRESGLDAGTRPTIYCNQFQRIGWLSVTFAIRTALPSAEVASAARRIVRRIDPEIPIRFRTIEEVVSASVADRRFNLTLVGFFGAAALLLAVAGTYGVVAYSVARRTREIGVRMALGAEPGAIRRLVLRQGIAPALVGLAVGVPAALALTRTMSGMLYGISPGDPATFAAVSAVLLAAALAACYVPARRASRVDPMVALRVE